MEEKIFSEKLKSLMVADFVAMNAAMVIPKCFRKLSDGAKGFWLGVQAVTLVIWAVWLIVCMVKKEKPFPGDNA